MIAAAEATTVVAVVVVTIAEAVVVATDVAAVVTTVEAAVAVDTNAAVIVAMTVAAAAAVDTIEDPEAAEATIEDPVAVVVVAMEETTRHTKINTSGNTITNTPSVAAAIAYLGCFTKGNDSKEKTSIRDVQLDPNRVDTKMEL
mmetsp:Transcript_15089/g.31301  ORF Transcript_15089/g.31301 Transcript_15089/m.31301 type:complete len:144 (+) Transcript_15089:790-1221(+)